MRLALQGFLLCAVTTNAALASAQARPFPGPDVQQIYQRLLPQIEKILAFDHHAHPVLVRKVTTRGRWETTRSSPVAAEQPRHRLLMGDRARAARGHPLPVTRQRGLYLRLLPDLGGRVTLNGPKAPQLR